MKKYEVLTPQGKLMEFKGIYANLKDVLKWVKNDFNKFSDSKSFQDWADELNDCGDYEGEFTKFDALDSLHSNYFIYVNRIQIDNVTELFMNTPELMD